MLRIVLGALKGAVIGGGLGYGAYAAGLGAGWSWPLYCLVGFVVGLLVGQPIWRHLQNKSSTIWTPILKGLFGAAIGAGLFAIVGKAWGTFDLELLGETRRAHNWPFITAGAIGALYGAFVEADDTAPGE